MGIEVRRLMANAGWLKVQRVFCLALLTPVGLFALATSQVPTGEKSSTDISLNDPNDVKHWGARGDGVTDDTNAFKTALAHTSNLTISIPGTYLLSSPIYLDSGQHIKGSANVILKKSSAYSQVFVNKAAITNGSASNSDISIEDLTIDVDNQDAISGAPLITANGNIQFTYADNVRLKNVSIINGGHYVYGVHFQSVTNSYVENYSFLGHKDALHINGGSHNIDINGFYIDSGDDAFGIMTDDYPRTQHNAQDISNITIRNGVSNQTKSPGAGYFARFMTGSWLPWLTGNSYDVGHVVVNAGKLYKMVNAGSIIGTDAPDHLSGDITGADGIQWRYLGVGTNRTSNIFNIKFSNIQILDGRRIIRLINHDSYNHGEYPGTENTSTVDGVYLNNVTSTNSTLAYIDSGKADNYGAPPPFNKGSLFTGTVDGGISNPIRKLSVESGHSVALKPTYMRLVVENLLENALRRTGSNLHPRFRPKY